MGATSDKAVTNHFPQLGENQNSEAPRVIFDPTLGDEGMETPPTNDSLKASICPPVGGHPIHSGETGKQTNVQTTC